MSQDSKQSWQNNSASGSGYKPWAPAPSQQVSSRNVWGPPTSDRTLGNGTFNPELSRVPDMHQSSNPGPIGPPPSRGNGQFQQGRGREQFGSRPAPIGPPNRQQGPLSREHQELKAAAASSGWGGLPSRLAQEDARISQQQEQDLARRRETKENGVAQDVQQPVIRETWRQVSINEDGTRSKVQASHVTIHDAPQSSAFHAEEATTRGIFEEQNVPRNFSSVGPAPAPQFNEAWKSPSNMGASPPVRGSRFFPNNRDNRDVRLEVQTFDRPGASSPPPPTMLGHPAYDGDISNPHVHLPLPQIVVKLPPAALAPIGPPKPASFAVAVQAPTVPQLYSTGYGRQEQHPRAHQYQDVRREPSNNWQDRINSLIGRKNSPPKSHLAVDSSSKDALEHRDPEFSATVSLPSLGSGDSATDEGSVESKPAAEECFEEQEMGSLPVIRVPISAPALAWSLAPAQPKSIPKKFVIQDVTSADPIEFMKQVSNNSMAVVIKVPGMEDSKKVNLMVPQTSNNPRRGGSRGTSRHPSSSHARGARGGRDPPSGFPSPSPDNASVTSSPSSGRGGRGGRGFGGSWNRHVPTPVHT